MRNSDFLDDDYSRDEVLGIFRQTLNRAKELGFNIHSECRFSQFLRAYESIDTTTKVALFDRKILDGLRDAYELKEILTTEKLVVDAKEEIQQIFSGSSVASADKNHISRNKQYQLFMTSLFMRSPYKTIYEEPDFSFEKDGRKYSVAVKRAVSASRIGELIRQAERQIIRYGHDGFIVLSLDRLAYEMFGETFVIAASNARLYSKAAEDAMFRLSRTYITEEMILSLDKRIKCLVISFGSPTINPVQVSFGYGFKVHFMPIVESEEDPNFHYFGKIANEIGTR